MAEAARTNARDPLVERLLGPGKPFELQTTLVAGRPQEVLRGAPRTLAAVWRQAARFGPQPMIVHDAVQLSFDEAFAQAAALAQTLREQFGVRRGTRVALCVGNRPEWIVSLIAITAAGGVAALVNSRGAAEELLRAIATSGCALAILDAERADLLAPAQPDPAWPRIIIGPAAGPLRPGRDAAFAALTRPRPGLSLEPTEVGPEDGALILFTSGTTGYPKAALLSHGAVAHGASLSSLMGALQDLRYEQETGEALPPDKRSMTSPAVILSPMFHLSGMLPVVRAIGVGASVHIMSKWNAEVAFDMIETTGLSRLGFVPTMLWDMLNSPRATPANLAKVRYMANGGGPLNPALVAEIRRRMPACVISNTWGQTENTAWATSISGQPYLDHPDSCGWACPTVQVCVRREDGSEAAPGEPGELWVRSPGVMTEYVGDAEGTAAALDVDGWCATGDIGVADAVGLFRIVDRKKNMVISGGENIYCAEVERVLLEHPRVREAIAHGEPDPRLGERLVATVVVEAGAQLGEEDLKAFCRQRLAIYKTPRAVTLTTEALPRTASGKVDRGTFIRNVRGG
jgi:long-chain acyl-CoA synthetase